MLSAVARLATFLGTCLALPRLRRMNEGFRTSGLIVPILGVVVSLTFVLSLNSRKLLAAGLALLVGAVVYALVRPRSESKIPGLIRKS